VNPATIKELDRMFAQFPSMVAAEVPTSQEIDVASQNSVLFSQEHIARFCCDMGAPSSDPIPSLASGQSRQWIRLDGQL